MKIQTKFCIFSSILITITVFSILVAGMLIIDQILYRLNKDILTLRVEEVIGRINEAYSTLKDAGVAEQSAYREYVRQDFADKYRNYKFGKTGFLYLLDESGNPLLPRQKTIMPRNTLNSILKNSSGIIEFISSTDKNSKFSIYANSKFNWKVVLVIDRSELFEKRNLYCAAVSIIGLILLIIALLLSQIYTSKFSKQTFQILNCVRSVAQDDLNHKIDIKPLCDEYAELQMGINSMIDELLEKEVEREKAVEEFSKHQKLESIGVLAGGIAHDFNNLLTAIRGNVQLAQMYHKDNDDDLRKCLTDTESATVRAMDLTRQLLTFAKGGTPIKTTASITELIENAATFVLRGTKCKCDFIFASDLKPVDIDTTQMSQVIDNLVINANQAMPDGGIIKIKAENVYIDEKSLMPLETGSYIKVSVKDHGKGILKQNLTKIFDPFFTTKPNGTGLGLATSYAIVKRHGGHITVESEVGVGSTFYIFMPVSNKAVLAKKASESKDYTDGGRILIMDDQESIRKILGKMLTLMNCECDYAEDGHHAVQMYLEKMKSDNKFDLVFMDLTIPGGMGGKDTIKTLKSIDPDITAVVASGYSNDPVMANYEDYGFAGRLEKPFKIDDLRKLMRQVLGNKIKNKNTGGVKNG